MIANFTLQDNIIAEIALFYYTALTSTKQPRDCEMESPK